MVQDLHSPFPQGGTGMAEPGSGQNPVWLRVSADSMEGLGKRRTSPSLRDLGHPLWWYLMKETVLACPNYFIFMADMDEYALLMVNQGLNAFCRKRYPGMEAHWLNTWGLSRHLTSIENPRFLCYLISCHGPLRGMPWLRVPGQVVCPGAGSNPCHSQLRDSPGF